jgi:hypothetical protein
MLALDLINSVGDLVGWGQMTAITDDSDKESRTIVRALNSILRAMQLDKDWPELNVIARMTTTATVSESNVISATRGSATVTLDPASTTTFAVGDVGKYIQINGSFPYKIATRVDARTITLERVWAGATVPTVSPAVPKGSYAMFSMIYTMPSDYDRLLGGDITILDTGGHIKEVSPAELREEFRDKGVAFVTQDPEHYAVYGLDSSGNALIHFDAAFGVARTLEYAYQKKHPEITVGSGATNIQILYPDRYNLYIVDQAVAKLSRDKENAAQVQQQASDAYKEAVRANSNPATGRERVVMTVDALRHGSYRRR